MEICKKRAVIICSTSVSNYDCAKAVGIFKDLEFEVFDPFKNSEQNTSKSLLEIQKEYLEAIDECDLVIAIPKTSDLTTIQVSSNDTRIIELFGESVSYELAYARHIGKPIIIYDGGLN